MARDKEDPKVSASGQAWLSHPFTQKAHTHFREQAEHARTAFFAACAKSADPDVRGALAELRAYELIAVYTGESSDA